MLCAQAPRAPADLSGCPSVSVPSFRTGLCEGERSMKHLEEATLGHYLVFAATILACNEWKRLVTVGQLGAEQEFL